MSRGCVCVFAKPPRPGTVKTRLATVLGDDGAAALARAFLLDTWNTVTRVSGVDVVLAATELDAPEWRSLHAAEVWPQGAGTLGDRLERVLRRALQAHPFAIAIGTDIPGLPVSRFDDARDALRAADAVLGPADDGGFYLIGVSTCPHGLLDTVPWSASDTCARTLERLGQHHLTTTVIAPWLDVDAPADLDTLRRRLRDGTIHAPETARILGGAAATESSRARTTDG
jgi:rSAM/selenodomain-associated transferase 1